MEVTQSTSAPTPPATPMPMVAPLDMPVDTSEVDAWVRGLVGSDVDVEMADESVEDAPATLLASNAGVEDASRTLVGADKMLVGRMLDRSKMVEEALLPGPLGKMLVTNVVGRPVDTDGVI